ncbi:uncharacterized protein LOC141765335 [Sebastes fasciatus]|uniref:uncharacterized protein LOC141765335 n=1 Tax=Sebastes fasciatus TaxID=394691 RepID=UPI003D9EB851
MIILILLSCFTIMGSAVPTPLNVFPHLISHGGTTQAQRFVEATNQLPDAQTPAPLSPYVEQSHPGVPQQPGPQGGPQFWPPTLPHYTWPPLGGSPMIVPVQPNVFGSQPANQPTLPQQPLIFPPYTYFFSSPYRNQLYSPYGFPMILDSPPPQTPANQPPNSPALPAETPSGAAPSGDALQLVQQQQQQNPQIVLLLQQPKSSPLGSLSSEELQMAAELGQLSVYLSTMLTNSHAGAVQSVSQAAGLVNPEQQGVVPTVGTSSVPQTPGPASSGPQPNANGDPAGLERPAQEAATVQTPVQPTQPNLV